MKKSIRQRGISLLTAAVTGLTSISLGSFFVNAAGAGESTDAGPIFYADKGEDGNGLPYQGINELYAEIGFETTSGTPINITTPDNTYYLLVHAVGEDNTGYPSYTYDEGESHDHYRLIEINADGESWSSGRLEPFEEKEFTNVWGESYNAIPASVSVEGFVVKNNDPTTELSLEDAVNGTNCKKVDSIEGLPLKSVDSLTKITSQFSFQNDTFEPKAIGGHSVDVNVYDYTGENLAPLQDETFSNYYVLSYIYPKGEDPKTLSQDDIIGWSLNEIDPKNEPQSHVDLYNFIPYADGGMSTSGDPIPYNAEEHGVFSRVYAANGQMFNFAQVKSDAKDEIPGYRFENKATDPTTTTINIISHNATFDIVLDFEEPVTIKDSDNIYAYITVEHKTSPFIDYFVAKVTGENTDKIVIPVQTIDESYWLCNDRAGATIRESGNEIFDLKLYKTEDNKSISDIPTNEQKTLLQDGMIFKGHTLTYEGMSSETDNVNNITSYKNTVSFKKVVSNSKNYDFKEILGNGLYFGITADRFEQQNHDIQSNFQTNYYGAISSGESDGMPPVNPNLSGDSSGAIAISKYVNFNGDTKITDDTKIYSIEDLPTTPRDHGRVFIGKGAESPIYLYTDSPDRVSDPRTEKELKVIIEDPEETSKKRVEPVIEHMKAVSAELLESGKVADVTPIKTLNNAYIDLSSYPDNATYYVDGDEFSKLMGGQIGNPNAFQIKMKENQMLVFNFDEVDEVTLGMFDFIFVDENGDEIASGTSKASTEAHSEQNKWLDKISQHIVWNLTSLNEIHVDNCAGIYLVPDPDSTTQTDGASTGWLITDGYFTNVGGEWHFSYTDLPEDYTQVTTVATTTTTEATTTTVATTTTTTADTTTENTTSQTTTVTTTRTTTATTTRTTTATTTRTTTATTTRTTTATTTRTTTATTTRTTTATTTRTTTATTTRTTTATTTRTTTATTTRTTTATTTRTTTATTTRTTTATTTRTTTATTTRTTTATTTRTTTATTTRTTTATTTRTTTATTTRTTTATTTRTTTATTTRTTTATTTRTTTATTTRTTTATTTRTTTATTTRTTTATTSRTTTATTTRTTTATTTRTTTATTTHTTTATTTRTTTATTTRTTTATTTRTTTATTTRTTTATTTRTTTATTSRTTTATTTRTTTATTTRTTTATTTRTTTATTTRTTTATTTRTTTATTTRTTTATTTRTTTATTTRTTTATTTRTTTATTRATTTKMVTTTVATSIKAGVETTSTATIATGLLIDDETTTTTKATTTTTKATTTTTKTTTTTTKATTTTTKATTTTTKATTTTTKATTTTTKATTTTTKATTTTTKATTTTTKATTTTTATTTVTTTVTTTTITADVNISKQNTFGTEISGASLELTGIDDKGNSVKFDSDSIVLGEDAVLENIGDSLKWISGTTETIVKSIPDGNYTLHEVAAPDGYEVTTDINFTIKDGKVIGSSSNSITMVDTMKGEVQISKSNVFGDEIKGASLTLTGKDKNGNDIVFDITNVVLGDEAELKTVSNGTSVTWISGTTSTFIKDLASGTYTLHEVAAPSGYEVTTDIVFTLEDGKITTESDSIDGNTVTMIDDMTKTDVQISKANVYGDEVKGATLTLTGTDLTGRDVVFDLDNITLGTDAKLSSTESGTSVTWVSGSTSTFVKGLADGTYTLHEEAAPAGYLVTTDIQFTIKDGVVTGDSENVDSDSSKVTMIDDMIITTDVEISKQSVLGSELQGAKLTLTGKDSDGNAIELDLSEITLGKDASLVTKENGTEITWISGSTPTFIGNLVNGVYTLHEVASPTGYEVTTDIVFTVNDGQITGETSVSGSKVTMIDGYILSDVTISKQNVLGNEIKGATITLTGTDLEGNKVVFDLENVGLGKDASLVSKSSGSELTWVSGSTDTTIGKLKDGTYTLHEVAAPNGYVVTTDITFTIVDGKLTGDTSVSGSTVTMIDDYRLTDVAISKQNVLGSEIKGATLTLTGTDLEGSEVVFDISKVDLGEEAKLVTTTNGNELTWISGSTATLVRQLKDGTYTIHEVAAPSGYVVTTDITFTLVNGQITGDVQLDTDGSIIVIDDFAVTTTTTTATTTTNTATTTTTAATTTTTAAKAGTKTSAPKTGDAGVGIAFAMLAIAAGTAFAVRRRKEEE